uniref:Uncharacterized protein n=1 Tax=Rosa rugosa TaxID=74645 RepID=J7FY87_ROSRU|nr:hypothetical protein [Rosa rugosa]
MNNLCLVSLQFSARNIKTLPMIVLTPEYMLSNQYLKFLLVLHHHRLCRQCIQQSNFCLNVPPLPKGTVAKDVLIPCN